MSILSRDDAAHEFVEERDGEGHVAVGWAVNHAFVDELGSDGAGAADFCSQDVGHVACAVRAGA